jgi:AmmeMemoRadiSam system protein B
MAEFISTTRVREPQFAGKLYPQNPTALKAQIASLLKASQTPEAQTTVRAILVPYAEYDTAAGAALAAAYKHVAKASYDTVVVLSPAPKESFDKIVVAESQYFSTSLGKIELNDYTRNEMADEDDDIFLSDQASLDDDATEVQLPFLQETIYANHPFRLVPIILGNQTVELCNELAHALSEVLMHKNALLVVPTNFVQSTENLAVMSEFLEEMIGMDYGSLLRKTIRVNHHFATGLGNIAVAVKVCLNLGAKKFSLLHRQASADGKTTYLAAAISK